MVLSNKDRKRLAEEQAALVAAIVAGSDPRRGFDRQRLQATAVSLQRKRMRVLRRTWPKLSRALGNHGRELLAEYVASTPPPSLGGPLADGRTFARTLAARGELPEPGILEALAVDLRFRSVPGGLVRRRWPTFRVIWLPQSRQLVCAVAWSEHGSYSMRVPYTRLSFF